MADRAEAELSTAFEATIEPGQALPIDEESSTPEDVQVVCACARAGIPIIFVGEPRGGLTGSCELWDGPWSIQPAAELWTQRIVDGASSQVGKGGDAGGAAVSPVTGALQPVRSASGGGGGVAFADVVQWPGFSDRTWVILPTRPPAG